MKTWKTKTECKVIQVLSGRSNAYLIIKGCDVVLVDTGKKSSFATLSKKIIKLDVKVENISVLILTHTHFDHCQSARNIKEKSNCKVIVSRIAADSIQNGYTILPEGTFPTTKLIAKFGRWIGKRKYGYEPFQPDVFVTDNYGLNIANCSIKIIETTGHSLDSLSVIVDNEIAIVGDAMFGVFKNSIFPPYSDDIGQMIKSWGKLLNTDCNIFLPGHGKEIKRSLLQKESLLSGKKNITGSVISN